MGADAFIAFCGLRYLLSDDEVEAVEANQDDRVKVARSAKLDAYFGRLTDGEPYFFSSGHA